MGFPDSTNTPFRFTLEWNRNGYQRGYNEALAKRIELHESMENMKILPTTDPVTLINCLTKFTEREQLGEADTWYCPKCKNHVRAFKKFDLFSLPRVLIFHLKRFRYAQNSFYMHRDKISTLVDFPIDSLDLSEIQQTSAGSTTMIATPGRRQQRMLSPLGHMCSSTSAVTKSSTASVASI
ncbi:unnamed protein product [Peronospora belbahrii]|uniref:USP domain-containing protein n=1 Tax=Peronospora belbahrii TaxID=622444 RepID=A0ABN8CU45_9STRA|nr:unnamed protein product [Peronospora belbahrii]